MTHQEEAQLSYRLFNTYRNDSKRQEWLDERIRDYQFAMGQQWTGEESKELLSRGQVDYVWNHIHPFLRHYESLLTSRVPEAQLIPAGDVEKTLVSLMGDVLKYILQISYWPQQFRRAMKSMLHKGLGWIWVQVDPFSSGGMGDIRTVYLNVQDVYVPQNASDIFFDDAEALIISRVIPLSDAQKLYSKVRSDLERAAFTGLDDSEYKTVAYAEEGRTAPLGPQETGGVPEFKNVRVIHRFTKERRKVWQIWNELTGETRIVEQEPRETDLEMGELFSAPYFETRVRMVTSAGPNVYIDEEYLPMEHWPLIPFIYEDTENPYPIGAVTLYKGMQKLLNKFCSVMLLHVQLSAALRVMAEKGSIDLEKWQSNFPLPGSINEYNPGHAPPTIVQITPIAGAMFQLAEDIKRELSYETASMPFHQGSSEQIAPTYSQTLLQHEESQRRMSPVIQQVDMSIQRMYEVMLQMVPYVYTDYRLLTIIDSESMEVRSFSINEEKRDQQTGEVLRVLNDVTKFKARVFVRTGSSIEPSRTAYLTLFSQLSRQFPIFAKYALQFLDVPFRNQMIHELDENQQLRQLVQQYGQQLQEFQQLVDSLEIAVRDRDRKVELQKLKAATTELLADFQMRLQTQAAIAKTQTREVTRAERS